MRVEQPTRLKLIAAGFVSSLLGGSCALAMVLLVVLVERPLLAPVEPPRPRETAVLSSWPTPLVVTAPPVIKTSLPPAATPAIETPEVLAPIVTPPISFEQGLDQINPAPASPAPAFGEVATRLVIPAIGLDTPVVLAPRQDNSWEVDHLGQTVGQLEGTASPGSRGNIVLAGHYTLLETNGGPGPFYNLRDLVAGDTVLIYQDEEKFEYVIDNFQTIDETAAEVTYSRGIPQLTLLTCMQWDRNQGRYVKRLIVNGFLL
jgi:sortase A